MKVEVDQISAVPSKRLFLSIIVDYDLNRSICELVDNALDTWIKNDRAGRLIILINMDQTQQSIRVKDNAGGVKKENLNALVGPGQTGNDPADETIGIFGVGTKRAVVALSQDIRITTRFGKAKTYSVELDDEWLNNEKWDLPVYEVDQIEENTTVVELHRLRMQITEEAISQLINHLRMTYAKFLLEGNLEIKVNDNYLLPITFEKWSYPPNFEPHDYFGEIKTHDGKLVKVNILAGLSTESSPSGEYGVYLYCNKRLIEKEIKSYDVGFTKGLAGKPHPDISLARVMVFLQGQAQSMPWNSSKSALNPNHPVFVSLRPFLVQVVKDFTSTSRRFQNDWEANVFQYVTGAIKKQQIRDFATATNTYLPPLPKMKASYSDKVKQVNRQISNNKPWTIGLYESIIAVDLILKQPLSQKNRIALILLDSTIEIAFKEYLVNESGQNYSPGKLLEIFKYRHTVHAEIKKYVTDIKSKTWKKIDYYYNKRSNLIHERSTVAINDSEVKDYRKVVQLVLKRLFKLQFKA